MELLNILFKELQNINHVYLYEENGSWYAYEQSAYYCHNMFQAIKVKRQIYNPYAIIIVKAEITIDEYLDENWHIISCSDNELELLYKPSLESFNQWKENVPLIN